MQKFFWLFAAGGMGTLARFGLASFIQRVCSHDFPFGTLVVNLLGCFLFGLVWSLADESHVLSAEVRFIILTGFMGAFTTFSTFAFESAALVRDASWGFAAANVLGQNVFGITGVVLGMALGRLF